MKSVYVWEYLDGITDNWHHGGGALVVAESLDDAKAALIEESSLSEVTDPPDFVGELVDDFPLQVMLFPDAGCC